MSDEKDFRPGNGWSQWRGQTTESLKGLHKKFDNFSQKLDDHIEDDNKRFNDIDKRFAKWAGAATAIITIVNLLFMGWIKYG